MSSGRGFLPGFVLLILPVVAIAAAIWVGSDTIERGLQLNAANTTSAWAKYMTASVADLEEIAAGAEPSPETIATLNRMREAARVFRVKLFGPDGKLRMILDDRELSDVDKASLAQHNPEAAAAAAGGAMRIEVAHGTPPERPAYYSEAYVPLRKDGKTIAIAEIYVDQTDEFEDIQTTVARSAILLSIIILIASGVPVFGFVQRYNAKRRADARAAYAAEHDGLTGLLNRSGFIARKRGLLAKAKPVVVVSLGIDRFGAINTAFGPERSDYILLEAAERLKSLAEPEAIVGRVSGTEFAFALNVNDLKEGARLAERALKLIRRGFVADGHVINLTASAGLTVAEKGEHPGSPLSRANVAMRRSRAKGGDRLTIFDRRMGAELEAGRDLETVLRAAVEHERFELYYQPIFTAKDRSLAGFEALLRMPNGEGGFVSPARFIPLAEQLGLIHRIGRLALNRACETAKTWPDGYKVAVNLSPVQFDARNIVEIVRQALAKSELPPERLELEITEGVLLIDSLDAVQQLSQLRDIGVKLALDDFGTGFSSLAYLWKLPVDKVKIDQSFLRAMESEGDGAAAIIRSIVVLGHSLGLVVTAEGVETPEQLDFLEEIGCDFLQGYHLGRPASAEAAASLAREAAQERDSQNPAQARGRGAVVS
ncbi:diguanylate cyclase (GGDEF)-like protein [Rhodopseudomonas julia]|uniref:Diguanylate cyclase (GGDEF)-like protein n=1 Tax=Rhodopseudomonas julia TaxID=200617 RepID=A0ABU0C5F2_9BRAD|nr:bifunctional diguanylate cyclase/phosphodiesterase [Rhodopseudomonas julia]MDQ0325403.1 diguanylate cyclase (GGDEF)-like protein [Rhodopseudomonas julia]